ncbi:MAG: T9SS type A sorting domain-containing protein, partial [Bacteroidales bacterium]|nr:T9SS type A sorting domain-containing protein [Bacteroidales bacterium]
IKSLAAKDSIVLTNSSHTIYCTAEDHESPNLNYLWFVNGNSVAGTDTLLWQVPADSGLYVLSCIVGDGPGLTDEASLNIRAVQKINYPPEIISINADPRIININASSEVVCHAYDANADPLIYEWSARAGEIVGSDSTAIYYAPANQGNYYICCKVSDPEEASSEDSLLVLVKDPALGQTGDLVAWYTFSNSTWDSSGYDHNGIPQNIIYVDDMNDNPASAMNFYDVTSSMTVSNTDLLNFRDGLTVSYWMEVSEFYDREAYPISHGNWQNRWKMSIGEQLLRFTINGTNGIIDLDTETSLEDHVWYHVAAIYNGTECQILLNAELDAVKDYSGQINTTSYDLILGQSLPSQSGYNFKGSIDNLRIYNYGISYDQVKEIYEEEVSSIKDMHASDIELEIYPNPCYNDTRVRYLINDKRLTICDLYLISGIKIRRLLNEEKMPGTHELNIDVSDLESGIYFIKLMSGNRSAVKKLIVNK